MSSALHARTSSGSTIRITTRCFATAHPTSIIGLGVNHALGGERHDRGALRQWFGRLGRLAEHLTLTVEDIWVKGLPHDTTIIIRWSATDTPPDGFAYRNHGVHIVHMKWGKVVAIDANEDSQAVAENLARLVAMGIAEAGAAPITS